MRKTLSLVELIGDFETLPLDQEHKEIVRTCKGTLPTEIAQPIFLTGCMQAVKNQTTCECLWKKVHGKFSNEEVDLGMEDPNSIPGVEKCSSTDGRSSG
jgi:hypothetical protein